MIYPVKTVYLGGPITGLTHDEARYGWREQFASLLPEHILGVSPMRAKDFLKSMGPLPSDPALYPDNPFSSAAGIVTRDRNDVRTCDAMVACFLETSGVASIGTAIEFGWADAFNKPIIMVVPISGDVHSQHCMVQRLAGYSVTTLEEAARILVHLLTPSL